MNGRVGLLAPLEAFVLEPLRVGQQFRIYSAGSDRLADLPHAFADCVEKRPACVLHQTPTVSNLNGARESPLGRHRVAASAIPGDYGYLRLASQPCLRARRLPVRQK